MSAEKLREALAGPVTPGEWFVWDGGVCAKPMPADGGNVICLEPEPVMSASLGRWPANAALIVAAVNAAPGLLATLDTQAARIAELEAENARMREAVAFYGNEWEQDVDAELTANGWEGRIGELQPSEALRSDGGNRARAALQGGQHG